MPGSSSGGAIVAYTGTSSDASSFSTSFFTWLLDVEGQSKHGDPSTAFIRCALLLWTFWMMLGMACWAAAEIWSWTLVGYIPPRPRRTRIEAQGTQKSGARDEIEHIQQPANGPAMRSKDRRNKLTPTRHGERAKQHQPRSFSLNEVTDPSIETTEEFEAYEDVFKLDLPHFQAYMRKNRFERSRRTRKHITITEERKVTIKTPHATGRASTTIANAIVDRRHST